ncbi:hypothetical protein VLK31_35070 [Variovorax sp. H27-G14]|uniref:hypothetical protein n=1 Tax=Variovorax sp. H27-G14 TaxID=3111914 RepID=UPI0038FCA0EE
MRDLIHLQPQVIALAGPFRPDPHSEIVSISQTSSGLAIQVEGVAAVAEVVFPTTWGFRVLDELDLAEFWSQCSMKTGWLFEVTDGGWKALELHRAHFTSGRLYGDLREFLVVGMTLCASVLSQDEPVIRTHEKP